MRRVPRRSKEHGAALILTAMAAVVILFAVVVARVQLQNLSTQSSLVMRNDVQSRDQARAGLEMALQQLRVARTTSTASTTGSSPYKLTACRLNELRLPQSKETTYGGPSDDASIPGCSAQTGQFGPRSMILGRGCVTWYFGLVDEVNQTVQLHVASVAPYVPRDGDDSNCSLEGLTDGGGAINFQGGVTYQLTATVSTWTSTGRPAGSGASEYTDQCAANGSIAVPCVLRISYDKRTFNL
jgi:hypothetical protein